MKVKEITRSSAMQNRRDGQSALEIEVNGKTAMSFYDGEPEDASINRDFNDVNGIVGLMQQAFDAGKAGEDFDLFYAESDDI